jgi:hypothetical protein
MREEPQWEFEISSGGLNKKAIVRKLIKAINPASGRAAGGDFPSKTWTSFNVPLSVAESRGSWLSQKDKSKL